MTLETTKWDVQDALRTPEDCALYIQAALEEAGDDDPAFVAVVLGDVARALGMAKVARDAGVSREGLYKALSANGNPSFATVAKVARALGLRLRFERVPVAAA